MPIELTHLGEAIVQMLIMEDPAYFVSEWKNGLETLNGPEVFREAELEMFSGVNGVCDHEVYREVQLAPFADKIFDGASRVDLIVPMTADEALPIEVKLGETRLSKSRLEDEWLLPCRATHHN